MPSIKISKRTVDAAVVPTGNDALYWDTELKGFGLRVTPKGVRSYVVQYRMKGMPARRSTIGIHGSPWTADKARERASAILIAVKSGIDPVEEQRKKVRESRTLSFEGYLDRFVEGCLKEEWKDSWQDVERLLRSHVLPKLKGRALPHMTRGDIGEVIDPLRSRKALARKTWAVLSRFFTWAIEQGDITKFQNPMDGMKPPPKPADRKRTLAPDELKALWRATYKLNDPFGPFVRMLLASLQRRNEVSGLPWKELSRDKAIWIIDGERAKNEEDHLVPLNSLALRELEAMGWKHRGLVFTTTGKTPISGFSKMKKQLDRHMLAIMQEIEGERAKAVGEDPELVTMERWTLHDLRRTGATGLQALGTPIEVVEALLNHKEGETQKGIRKIYNLHKYEAEKAVALNKWAMHLESLVAAAPASNVIALAERRA